MSLAEVRAAMCEGKHPFDTFTAANRVAERTRNGVSAYRCRFCGQWHVGRAT